MRINYSGNLYIHSDTDHTFQKYKVEFFGFLNKRNKLLGCFKAFVNLHLLNTFSNLLSFTLLNSELVVMEILFKSKSL